MMGRTGEGGMVHGDHQTRGYCRPSFYQGDVFFKVIEVLLEDQGQAVAILKD